MINEYAIEPELVATWGERENYRIYMREFGIDQGRLLGIYPKRWMRKVWSAYNGASEMNRKRLEELLARLNETAIKRKNVHWDSADDTWTVNAQVEHARHPFHAIIVRTAPNGRAPFVENEQILDGNHPLWDAPHGVVVDRTAEDIARISKQILSRCRWVRIIDPHISPDQSRYKKSLKTLFELLAEERPMEPVETIEIHTKEHGATADFLRQTYSVLIPKGMQVTLYQWNPRANGPALHNRFILTDLGGISFSHGLDTGPPGETDDVNRLSHQQYLRCKELYCYHKELAQGSSLFSLATSPILIEGTRE